MITNEQRLIPESAQILAWLTEALQISDGKTPDLAVLHRQDNPSSTHWVIGKESNHSKELFFVKMHASRALYSQERDALSVLSNYTLPTEPYAVPKMLASDDDLNCIVLEWIDGASIGSAIRSSVRHLSSSAKLKLGLTISSRVGSWLRQLKTRTSVPATDLPSEELLSRFIELVQLIETSRPGLLPKNSGPLLIRGFERHLTSSTPDVNCLAHNDFWSEHIWARREQIIVLDFGRARVGPAGRDAVQFYCRLRDMAIYNPFVSKKATDLLIQSFISGCGELDLSSDMNRVWQLLARAEQLAGLIEHSPANARAMLKEQVTARALAHQLLHTVY